MIAKAKEEAVRKGELLRDVGVMRATSNRQELIQREELKFLDFLAANGTGTTDDTVEDLAEKYRDGGKWRGSIPLGLARDGLIEAVGFVRSNRTHRHRAPVRLWAICDSQGVDARRLKLRSMLAALDETKKVTAAATGIAEAVESALTHQSKDQNDGQVK